MKNITHMPFQLRGEIYRAPMPMGKFDYDQSTLAELKAAVVKTVVVLVQEFEWEKYARLNLADLYQNNGIEMIHYPVEDYGVPQDSESYLKLVEAVKNRAEAGQNIAVHCFAGIGRTGTFLSALAMKVFGWGAVESVQWVRTFIPGAVENENQLAFVKSLEDEGFGVDR